MSEIRATLSITANKGFQNFEFDASGLNIVMTNNGGIDAIQTIGIGATGELIDLGDLLVESFSSLGVSAFRNIEASGGNYVEIGLRVSGVFYPTKRLDPGMFDGGGVLGTSTFYARANTAPVKLQKFILEA